MPAEKHLNQNHLAAIGSGALHEYLAQPQGKSAQSTPNRKADIAAFALRYNPHTGAPRHPWGVIEDEMQATRQALHVRVRRVLRYLEQYAAALGLADCPICNAEHIAAHELAAETSDGSTVADIG